MSGVEVAFVIAVYAMLVLAVLGKREKRAHERYTQERLRAAEAEAALRGIEKTVRTNIGLGDGADIVGDLVLDKIDEYHSHRLKVELKAYDTDA